MSDDLAKNIWRCVAFMFCVFVLTVGGCQVSQSVNDNAALNKAIQSGANPLQARCLFSSGTEATLCALLATKGAQ